MGVYKCPVCEGCGTVPANFYYNYNSGTAVNTAPVTCKSCGGKGIVFDAEIFGNQNYEQFTPMSFVAKGTCYNCNHNDRMVYTPNPPKWKCTLNNEWHEADYRCEHWCEQQMFNDIPSANCIRLQHTHLGIDSASKGDVEFVNGANQSNTID